MRKVIVLFLIFIVFSCASSKITPVRSPNNISFSKDKIKFKSGDSIYFIFQNGSPRLRKFFEISANHWLNFVDLKFIFKDRKDKFSIPKSFANNIVFIKFKKECDNIAGSAEYPLAKSGFYPGASQMVNLCYDSDPTVIVASTIFTILHEVGHSIGLVHAHQNPNNTSEPFTESWCKSEKISEVKCKNQYLREKKNDGFSYGNYDPLSVMNYRKMSAENIRGSSFLSNGDIKSLRRIYPGPKNYRDRTESFLSFQSFILADKLLKESLLLNQDVTLTKLSKGKVQFKNKNDSESIRSLFFEYNNFQTIAYRFSDKKYFTKINRDDDFIESAEDFNLESKQLDNENAAYFINWANSKFEVSLSELSRFLIKFDENDFE